MRDHELSQTLLDWYDRHARELPWRVLPRARSSGQEPNAYRVWLSEVMLQQTTVAAVKKYFLYFTVTWPTVDDLANAADADVMAAWAGLGYYARARNLLKCARVVVSDHRGAFPAEYEILLTLPGIGPYTAAAISAIAFDRQETVLDGNVERVISRLRAVVDPLPKSKPKLHALAAELTPSERAGDYAQAIMDLGATICTPKSPACGICPWVASCKARDDGIADTLPKKLPKKPKPLRRGHIYLVQRKDGAWLLEKRPEKGLLGGMLGWPGTDWKEGDLGPSMPPIAGNWKTSNTPVKHTFTHFHLELAVHSLANAKSDEAKQGQWVAKADFRPNDLPTVMRKAYNLASHLFDAD